MKELRFRADHGVWRVAFAFDPRSEGILLVVGDKSGGSEKRFYRGLIKMADARYRQLKGEVESLAALRKAAGKAQTDLAAAMKVSQPQISKLEKNSDMYLSTLRGYVKALGGDIELMVRLPSGETVELQGLGDLAPAPAKGRAKGRVAGKRQAA